MGIHVNIAALVGALVLPAAAFAAGVWMPIAQENLLYVDLPGGTSIIELHPEVAPGHVVRIKELARAGFYDGITFHRVIDDFMAQGGDPTGTGEGGSEKPDLVAEFTFREGTHEDFGRDAEGQAISISGSAVILTEPEARQYSRPDGRLQSWMPHCRGVASMARTSEPNTANSQFFIMFSAKHQSALDRNYSAWGRVVHGMEFVDAVNRGEPPLQPTKISRMRVGTDVPASGQVQLEVMSPSAAGLRTLINDMRNLSAKGIDACDIEVPVRVAPSAASATPQEQN